MAGQYNETQVRREFIDPFFKELGWDIDNEQGYAEAYKDVVHEDAIRIGGMHKAPDYCMRIGGVRKFFVEAKKPSVNVKDDTDPAFQVRRYAWSAKLPLSILTDFQEIAIYDCRLKPVKTDSSSKARIQYFTYKEYIEKWDEIASVFSRDAVLKGSFDKYAEATKKKKGTEEVDDAFLKEIENWRELLAKNIALRNPNLSQRELNFAVQVSIDRLVFLRICEDRGIENYGRLLAEVDGTNIYGRLKQHFRDADDRYNSGLFHFENEKDQSESADTLTLGLQIDDDVLKEIISHLYYPESPYEFSVLSADILGQVYEQFLGKVIRLTDGHRAKIEEKPEVRKAGGVYYTPTYIVQYIVEHTIGKLVKGKTPKKVEKLKICDPACGSGSFLLGAYQFLLDWHLKYYMENDPNKWNKQLTQSAKGDWRLSTAERKRILLNNIFGVDIDAQAVEVTKLSLLLKVLEGETEQSLKPQLSMFKERALPNLGSNIKCGNSLIGPDFFMGQQMGLLETEEQYRINVFDWEKAFPQILTGKSAGFDAIIGNPPYILLQTLNSPQISDYFSSRYTTARYKIDTYHLFIERGMHITKNAGLLGYIIPNSFLRNKHALELRRLILNNTKVQALRLFFYSVFKDASVDTAVLIVEKSIKEKQKHEVAIYRSNSPTDLECEKQLQEAWSSHPQLEFGFAGINGFESVIKKIEQDSIPLKEFATAYFGIQTHNRDKFVATDKQSEDWKPVIDGGNISQYQLNPSKEFVNFTKMAIKSGGSENVYKQDRIGIRQIGAVPVATILPAGLYTLNTVYNLYFTKPTAFNLNFVLGFILSKLGKWYWKQMFYDQKRTFPKIKKEAILSLPIRKIDSENKELFKKIESGVQNMLGLQKQLASAKTPNEQSRINQFISMTEESINNAVFALYGLSDDEVEMIKSSFNKQ